MGVSPARRTPMDYFRRSTASPDDSNLVKGDDAWAASHAASGDAADPDTVTGDMIWNESIARSLGYGKKGAAAAYQWWIPVVAGLTSLAAFIAWAVLVVRGRDATSRAMAEMGVAFPWWASVKGLIAATAVLYPVFVAFAIFVNAWRGHLARTLDIHKPDPKWQRSCRNFQRATVVAHTLLWIMVLMLIVSVAGHAVWGYMAQMADIVSTRAVALIGPVWGSVARIAESSKSLSDRFTGMLSALPAIGGRRLLEEAAGAAGAEAAGTVGSLLAAAGAAAAGAPLAAAGHGRALQQTPLLNSLGQLAQGIAQGITAAANSIPADAPSRVPANVSVPGLPQILPNGSSNPLFNAINQVTDAIEDQIFNPDGCPIYCVDLRHERWWVNATSGCLCNLDRVAAAVPHLRTAWRNVLPAIVALVFMYAGASWLMLHGAAQWARTRNEAKLMARIPGAEAAAAAADEAAKAASPRDYSPPPPPPLATV